MTAGHRHFRNWKLKSLLNLWAVLTIAGIILLTTLAVYVTEQTVNDQRQLLQESDRVQSTISGINQSLAALNAVQSAITSVPINDSAESQSLGAVTGAITKQVEALARSPASELADVSTTLHNQANELTRINQEIESAAVVRRQLEQQLDQKGISLESFSTEIRQQTETLANRAAMINELELTNTPDDDYDQSINRIKNDLLQNLAQYTQLGYQLRYTRNEDVLEGFDHGESQIFSSAIRRALTQLQSPLSENAELTERLEALSQYYESLFALVMAPQDSIVQLRRAQLENNTRLDSAWETNARTMQLLTVTLNDASQQIVGRHGNLTAQTVSQIEVFRWTMMLIALLTLLGIGWLMLMFRKKINHPMAQLRDAMRSLQAENFDVRLPLTTSRSEFSSLAKDFNAFAQHTQALIAQLADAKNSLQVRERHISAVLNGVPEAILTLSSNGTIASINDAAPAILHADKEQLIGENLLRFVDESHGFEALDELVIYQQFQRELEGRDFDNVAFSMWLSMNPLNTIDSDLWVCVISDITSWKTTKQALEKTSTELNAILENAMVGIAFIRDGRLMRVNQKFESLFDCHRDDVEGESSACLYPDQMAFEKLCEQTDNLLARGQSFETQVEMTRLSGEAFWCQIASQALDPNNPAEGSIWLFEDVTRERENEARLTRLASIDTLTGLPNRAVFNDRLEHALHKSHRQSHRLAVCFIDLDHFKNINDSLGHKAGDQLLCEVAKRLRSCVREGDTVARLGGDEFTVILEEIRSARYVGKVAEKLLATISMTYFIENTEVNISPSIGISLYPADGRDVDILVRNADAAMYHAKGSGRNNFQFYSAEMNAEAALRLSMETSLRRAVEQNEFYLNFQPQISMQIGEVIGCEVLLRWHTEQWGDVSPARFVPILEDTGLIGIVGEWVLRESCTAFMSIREHLSDDFVMAVNLSGRQFRGGNLASEVSRVLNDTGMPAGNLELEITESLLMADTNLAIGTLRELSYLGVTLAIDDFGTGYSSLSYLKQFPLNVLKIDRSFVNDVTIDNDDAAIVEAIMAMAERLGLKIVAEGVETAAQLQYLQRKHCHRAQGFYFSRPLALPDFVSYLQDPEAVRA